jgi:hypothetical protein
MTKKEKRIGVKYISIETETPAMIEEVLKMGNYHQNVTVWLIINQLMGSVENHIITEKHIPVIAFKSKVDENDVIRLIENLVKLNPDYFNYDLWTMYRILRIDKIVDHYTQVYSKNQRSNQPATVEEILTKLSTTVTEKENSNSKGSVTGIDKTIFFINLN